MSQIVTLFPFPNSLLSTSKRMEDWDNGFENSGENHPHVHDQYDHVRSRSEK